MICAYWLKLVSDDHVIFFGYVINLEQNKNAEIVHKSESLACKIIVSIQIQISRDASRFGHELGINYPFTLLVA